MDAPDPIASDGVPEAKAKAKAAEAKVADTKATEPSDETQHALREEQASYHAARIQRRRLVPRAALVGLGAGLVGVGFRQALMAAEDLRDWAVLHHPWLIVFLIPGCMVSVWLVRRFAPEASGSGIPHLKAVMHGIRSLRGKRVLFIKFIGGVLGIGSGLALGREGPTTQMGGAVGQMVADAMGMSATERLTLIAAGAGAGLTAAFNAPIAGTVFVLEEIQRDFTPAVFVASLVATVVADVVTRVLSGQGSVIPITIYGVPPLAAVLPFLLVGVCAGVLGVAYNRGLVFCLDWFPRLGSYGGAVVGACVALVCLWWPNLVGGGYHVLHDVFVVQPMAAEALVGVWVLRYLLTMISYGCGAPGGIFAPLLVLGALLGLEIGQLTQAVWPSLGVQPPVYAVIGMAAYFTAIVRAPLTGIILIMEMTSNYNLTLGLLAASLAAYGVAEALNDEPIYDALLERDLLRSQHPVELREPMEVQVTVQAGSPFDGVAVKDLGLPPGCVLVMLQRSGEAIVPNGQTVLQGGDQVTAVVGPHAPDGLYKVRHGATAPN